jgi:hypothetical protein
VNSIQEWVRTIFQFTVSLRARDQLQETRLQSQQLMTLSAQEESTPAWFVITFQIQERLFIHRCYSVEYHTAIQQVAYSPSTPETELAYSTFSLQSSTHVSTRRGALLSTTQQAASVPTFPTLYNL